MGRVRERAHRLASRVWEDPQGGARVARGALAPAAALYGGVAALRNRLFDSGIRRAERAPIPVVSVGNLTVGGAGKTPISAWIAARLFQMEARPAVVMRGYGYDETLLHREMNPDIPVVTDRRRIRAVREAARQGCTVAVLDDGFQHRRLARKLDIVLVPADQPAEATLPAGPLREPFRALGRADLVLITRKRPDDDPDAAARRVRSVAPGTSISPALIAPAGIRPVTASSGGLRPLDSLKGRAVLAVCAIARPEPFLRTMRDVAGTVEEVVLPDHHPFTTDEVTALARRAGGRPLVMTWKDAVKVREHLPPGVEAWILVQQVSFDDDGRTIDRLLREVIVGR